MTQGATRDLTSEFQRQRLRAQQRGLRAATRTDDSLLREKMERFKPLNNKFAKKKRKEKCQDDEIDNMEPEYKGLRNSTLSDESGRESSIETTGSVVFENPKKLHGHTNERNIQGLATKASSDSISEDNSIEL